MKSVVPRRFENRKGTKEARQRWLVLRDCFKDGRFLPLPLFDCCFVDYAPVRDFLFKKLNERNCCRYVATVEAPFRRVAVCENFRID